MITSVVKRSGEVVPFDQEKVTVAIYKAAASVGGHDRALSEDLSDQVMAALSATYSEEDPPTVEDVQDVVERMLIKAGHARTAKAYILYRHERSKMRSQKVLSRVEYLPYKAMWEALDWAVEHGCHTVSRLNRIIRDGRLPWLIEKSR